MGCARVHQSIGNNSRCVADRDSDSILGLLENERVRLVVPDEELQVQVDWLLPRKDGGQFVHLKIIQTFHFHGWRLQYFFLCSCI